MDLGIKGKVALVCAATRGLGRGCAEQLAAAGCRVAICSRDAAEAEKVAAELAEQFQTLVGVRELLLNALAVGAGNRQEQCPCIGEGC